MLDSADIAFLKEHAYGMDHETCINGLIFGEPFLTSGTLHYYDGRVLTVDGFTLPRTDRTETARSVLNAVEQFYRSHSEMEMLEYFGPNNIDFSELLGGNFSLAFNLPTDKYNRDMQINLRIDGAPKYKRNQRKLIKQCQNEGIFVAKAERKELGDEHRRLMKSFLLTHDINDINKAWVSKLPELIKKAPAVIFEAKKDSELKGFIVVDTCYPKIPILMFGYFDRGCKGISSMMYDAVMKQFGNAEVIDLGYSINRGLYEYKLRMGANQSNPPFEQTPPSYSIRWKRTGTDPNPWWLGLNADDAKKNVGVY